MNYVERPNYRSAFLLVLVVFGASGVAQLASVPAIGVNASTSIAVTRPTPVNAPLTKKAFDELVERLKGTLAEIVEDEDGRTAITEKWDARVDELVGKTRDEVVTAFLDDARSVIDDADVIKALTEKFTAEPETKATPEPTPQPTPVPTPKPQNWIKFYHPPGPYTVRITITWDEPDRLNNIWSSKTLTVHQFVETVYLPGEATNIRLRLQNYTTLKYLVDRPLAASDLNKCFSLKGDSYKAWYENTCT